MRKSNALLFCLKQCVLELCMSIYTGNYHVQRTYRHHLLLTLRKYIAQRILSASDNEKRVLPTFF